MRALPGHVRNADNQEAMEAKFEPSPWLVSAGTVDCLGQMASQDQENSFTMSICTAEDKVKTRAILRDSYLFPGSHESTHSYGIR